MIVYEDLVMYSSVRYCCLYISIPYCCFPEIKNSEPDSVKNGAQITQSAIIYTMQKREDGSVNLRFRKYILPSNAQTSRNELCYSDTKGNSGHFAKHKQNLNDCHS